MTGLKHVPDSIVIKQSPIHGRGVFAATVIPAGATLCDNVPTEHWHTIESSNPRADDPCVIVWPDGKQRHHGHDTGYSWMDYLNHANRPNAEFTEMFGELDLRLLFTVVPGSELLIDYRLVGRTDF